MIIGVGIDLVCISRYEKDLLSEDPSQYLQSHFGLEELAVVEGRKSKHPAELYAARWAAKEAFVKAINGGDLQQEKLWMGWVDFREIQVLADAHERPYLELSGKVKQAAEERGVRKIHLSFSHEADYAMAIVLLES